MCGSLNNAINFSIFQSVCKIKEKQRDVLFGQKYMQYMYVILFALLSEKIGN